MAFTEIHFDPTSPNNWCDPTARYIVEVRPPQMDELFITGAKISKADRNYTAAAYPVIVGIV